MPSPLREDISLVGLSLIRLALRMRTELTSRTGERPLDGVCPVVVAAPLPADGVFTAIESTIAER